MLASTVELYQVSSGRRYLQSSLQLSLDDPLTQWYKYDILLYLFRRPCYCWYWFCRLTCGRPYSPHGSQESAEFLRTKSEGIAESVRTVVFSALVSGNAVCVLPIVCCLSAPPYAGECLPDLYTHSSCTIQYACKERTPKNQSPKPYPDYHSQQLYMNV